MINQITTSFIKTSLTYAISEYQDFLSKVPKQQNFIFLTTTENLPSSFTE
tara:strand:+ start:416 stop:565 length:150 start_codon:yes stop_codon:yes gene_type:complete